METAFQEGDGDRRKEPQGGLRGFLRAGENVIVAIALGAMVLLPLAEIVLRKFFGESISGVTATVQHLVLVVAMLGGAIAARDNRLLSMSTAIAFLKGRYQVAAGLFSGSIAVAITIALVSAGVLYILTTRDTGKTLSYGVPVWIVQLIMPIGFALVAWRIVRYSGNTWKGRLAVALAGGLIFALGSIPGLDASGVAAPALLLLLLATILGAPIFCALGGAAVILFWSQGNPIASIAVDHYRLVLNPSLAAIPLFTLAGYFLAEGGASQRLIRVFQALVGRITGGPAIVTALVCAFFTAFTGASGVTILALGGLLLPVLLAAGFSEKNALGLLTGAGSLGLLFAPCLPLILYAIVATSVGSGVTIEEMFLGGFGPGVLLVLLTAWWGVRRAAAAPTSVPAFSCPEALRAMWVAKWELLMPVVALVALFGGFATPVEAAAVTALYAFVVETFIYRDLKLFQDTPRVMSECALLVGGVLLILGVAMGFNNYLITEQIPDQAVAWVSGNIKSRWVFLLALNGFLLIVGCLMDILSAIMVVVPLIIPMAIAFGIDPVHLGIIFLANLELGYLTPPVGMNLFLSAMRFEKPLTYVYRSVIPMFFVLLIGVLLITYFPPLSLTLPGLLR